MHCAPDVGNRNDARIKCTFTTRSLGDAEHVRHSNSCHCYPATLDQHHNHDNDNICQPLIWIHTCQILHASCWIYLWHYSPNLATIYIDYLSDRQLPPYKAPMSLYHIHTESGILPCQVLDFDSWQQQTCSKQPYERLQFTSLSYSCPVRWVAIWRRAIPRGSYTPSHPSGRPKSGDILKFSRWKCLSKYFLVIEGKWRQESKSS